MNSANEPISESVEFPHSSFQLGLPEGIPKLRALYLYIAGSCNLACRHCWIAPNYVPEAIGGKFLPIDYIEKAIHEAIPLGLQSIKLTGGEPTLHPQFRRIVSLINRFGIDIIIETNGTLIDLDLAKFLANTERVRFISVSLDGADAATHEALRLVPGSFERAILGIQNLVSAGIHPQIICTVYQGNFGQLRKIISLGEELGCSSFKINHLQRTGRGKKLAITDGLSVLEVMNIFHFVQDKIIPESNIPILFDIPLAFKPIKSFFEGNHNARCNIHNILGILSSGDISICGIGDVVPDLIFGNIADAQIDKIWYNQSTILNLRKIIPVELEGICKNCLVKDTCLGHCIAINYYESGKLNSGFKFCEEADKFGLFPESRKINSVVS